MKTTFKLTMILIVALGLAAILVSQPLAAPPAPGTPAPASMQAGIVLSSPWQEAEVPGFRLVLGSNFTLQSEDVLDMNLAVLGGNALLKEGSTVKGSVILLGGNLTAEGTIEGDLIAMGGNVDLGSTALVQGDVQLIGGNLNKDPAAIVDGEIKEGPEPYGIVPFDFRFGSSGFEMDPITGLRVPEFRNPVVDFLWLFARAFIWAVLAVLAALFLATPITRVSDAAVKQPLVSGAVGCLTAIVATLLLILLAITIICIPLSLIGVFLLVVTWAYGIIALGTEVGRKLGQLFHQEWAFPLSAGLGTFLLTLVINGIGQYVPCVGWAVPLLAGVLGIGAVLVTRFGARNYPAYASAVDFTTPAAAQSGLTAPDAFQGDLPMPPAPTDSEQDKP
jgi:hypothetical protein